MRVVTLIPAAAPSLPASVEPKPAAFPEPAVGQLRAISLAALKTAYGKAWPRIVDRAMMLAEQIIRRRLGSTDVVSRRDDHNFVIWFDGTDEARNDAIVARMVREIRLRFLTEGGEDIPPAVPAASIGEEAIPPVARALPPVIVASDQMSDTADQPTGPLDAKTLRRDLKQRAVADVRPVTGRDGKIEPIAWVDFIPAIRRRIYELTPSLPEESDRGTGFDLIRFDLAAAELAARETVVLRDEASVLVPMSWPALSDPACRPALDERIARMRPDARSWLMLAVSGVPPLISARRWSDTVGPLQDQLGEVGLLLTRRDSDLATVRDAVIGAWEISLLVIDGTQGPPLASEAYFSLIAAARQREISILVRSPAVDDIRDWRELGATMFVAAA